MWLDPGPTMLDDVEPSRSDRAYEYEPEPPMFPGAGDCRITDDTAGESGAGVPARETESRVAVDAGGVGVGVDRGAGTAAVCECE